MNENERIAAQVLNDFASVLDELGVNYCLDGGTLLGAVRDHGFCDGDWDDTDLTTLDDPAIIPAILEKCAERGFTLHHNWLRNPDEHRTAQIAVKRDGTKCDLAFKEIKGDQCFWGVYRRNEVVFLSVLARFYTEPWAKIECWGREWNMPADIDNYLIARYGDWHTPVHRRDWSCYSTDKSIVPNFEAIK